MTGGENVYKYITTEGKVAGKKTGKITALEYLQKSTGVFNGNGLLSEEKVAEMKERLKNNKGNIWHDIQGERRNAWLEAARKNRTDGDRQSVRQAWALHRRRQR